MNIIKTATQKLHRLLYLSISPESLVEGKRVVGKGAKTKQINTDELKAAIEATWLIASMPSCISAVIHAKKKLFSFQTQTGNANRLLMT